MSDVIPIDKRTNEGLLQIKSWSNEEKLFWSPLLVEGDLSCLMIVPARVRMNERKTAQPNLNSHPVPIWRRVNGSFGQS